MNLAIVSSVKEISESVLWQCRYHKKIGINGIFLFLDQYDESYDFNIPKDLESTVHIIKNDRELRSKIESYDSYQDIRNIYDKFVTKRQASYVEFFVRELADGYDWLFHIDDDELIYCNENLCDYFEKIPNDFSQVVICNHEAVVLGLDNENFFENTKTFKLCPHACSSYQKQLFETDLDKEYYFTAYTHGKAAAKINSLKKMSRERPLGVHRFHSEKKETLISNHLDICLLHFPFPSFSKYFYKFSGVNSKRIYEYEVLGEELDNFYSKSRKVISSKNILEAEKLYKSCVIYNEHELEKLKAFKMLKEFELRI